MRGRVMSHIGPLKRWSVYSLSDINLPDAEVIVRTHLLLAVSVVMSITLIGGCSEATSPADDIVVKWTLSSAVVGAHDSVAATLILRNSGQTPVALVSSCTSIGSLDVALDGRRVDVRGAGAGCLTAMTRYTIPPRDSLMRVFQLKAETELGQPLRPGVYSVGFDSNIRELRGRVEPLLLEVR